MGVALARKRLNCHRLLVVLKMNLQTFISVMSSHTLLRIRYLTIKSQKLNISKLKHDFSMK